MDKKLGNIVMIITAHGDGDSTYKVTFSMFQDRGGLYYFGEPQKKCIEKDWESISIQDIDFIPQKDA